MYMILNLNKEKYLDDVLMALTEAGIDFIKDEIGKIVLIPTEIEY